jgi:HSP20 family protein
MDMYETAREIIILAEIAGVRKEDLELEISSKAVKICGRRKEVPEMERGTYRLAEIQYGQFERFLFLSAPVDTEKVTALYTNGLLKITLPKMLSDKTHKIPITEG